MAASLPFAASLSYDRASVHWAANTLPAALTAFATAASAFFEDAVPNDRPIGNWLVLIRGLATQMGAAPYNTNPGSLVTFNQAVEYLFRICWAANYARADGLISAAQVTGLLTAWNTNIGP